MPPKRLIRKWKPRCVLKFYDCHFTFAVVVVEQEKDQSLGKPKEKRKKEMIGSRSRQLYYSVIWIIYSFFHHYLCYHELVLAPNIVAHPLKQIMSLESTGSKTAFSYSSHVFLVPKLSLVYGKTNIHICTLDVNNSCLGFQSNFPTFLPCCLTLTFQANSLFDRSLHHKFSGEGSDLASGWFSNVQVVVVACTTICTTDVF